MLKRMMPTVVVFGLLVAYGAASRLTSIVPNFHAVAAAALFAGFYFRSRAAALAVPLATMALTDVVLGFHAPLVMAAVYAGLALPVALRRMLGSRPSLVRVGGTALVSSCAFYLLTNLAHWYCFYPLTWAGLARCYTVALPFFGYNLAGDMAYAAVLFTTHAALANLAARPRESRRQPLLAARGAV